MALKVITKYFVLKVLYKFYLNVGLSAQVEQQRRAKTFDTKVGKIRWKEKMCLKPFMLFMIRIK